MERRNCVSLLNYSEEKKKLFITTELFRGREEIGYCCIAFNHLTKELTTLALNIVVGVEECCVTSK